MRLCPYASNANLTNCLTKIITLLKIVIIAVRKRSLGQGNVFRSMCQSFWSERRSLYDITSCLTAWSHVSSRAPLSLVPCSFQGVSVQRGLCLGSLSRRLFVQEGLCFWGAMSRGSLKKDGSLSGGSLLRGAPGGSLSRGVSVGRSPPPRIRKVGGTHPTEMHSCYIYTRLLLS